MLHASPFKLSLTIASLAFAGITHAQTNAWAESYKLEYAGKFAEAQAQIETENSELSALRAAYLTAVQGKFADAEARYKKVAATNPKSIPALTGIMNQQMAQQRFADTIATAQQILKLNAMDYTAQTNIMFSQWKTSQWADLAKKTSEVSPYYPTDVSILVYGARAQAALGNKAEAKKMFGKVVDLFPGHIEATNYLKSAV